MIEFIEGILKTRLPHKVVIEKHGIGIEIFVSLNSYRELSDCESRSVTLLTHLHWREDGPQLFGFTKEDERSLFRLLNRVSKVGPKLAVNILSAASPEKLAELILADDSRALTSFKGIGPKLASRLILELKEPLSQMGLGQITSATSGKTEDKTLPFSKEVREALDNLGYSSREIDRAIAEVAPLLTPSTGIEEVLEKLLRFFSK
ncbi:MAG: Holliday junction branch migration protein RuvA [Candidatus Riflebacteria bacterium]|nr:Holliday junction branch migration protein RuvA [Candidatus Riflebacteria bacterium]